MKNPQKREVMLQAYSLVAPFEQPNQTEAHWDGLRDACVKFCADWPGDLHEYAVHLSAAIWDALEAEYKAIANKPA